MNAMRTQKKHRKTTAILVITGVVMSFLASKNHETLGLLFVTDILFAISMAFFCWGLICLVRNMGMFDSLAYGTKCLIRIFRGKWGPSGNQKDGYFRYIRSRPRHEEVSVMMLQAAVFAILSIIVSFTMR